MNTPRSVALVLITALAMSFILASPLHAEDHLTLDHTVLINDAKSDPFNQLLVDQYGNSYLVGATSYSHDWAQPDAVLVAKHDAQGKLLWKKYTPRTNPVHSGNDPAIRSLLDSLGNLYVLLSGSGGVGELIKFSPNGSSTLVANSGVCTYCLMHIDHNDNLYIFGSGSIEKYSHGILQWNVAFGTSRIHRTINSVAVDDSGNVYLYGDSRTRKAVTPLLVKLDSNGKLLWNQFIHYSETKTLFAKKVLLDSNNDVFITAHVGGEEHLMKYSQNGESLVHSQYLSSSLNWYFGSQAFIDQYGEVTIIATTTQESAMLGNHHDLLLLKYNNAGEKIVQKIIDFGVTETTKMPMHQDSQGNLFLSINGNIAKLDPQGSLLWHTQPDRNYRYQQITADEHGKLYAAGHYSESGFEKKNNSNFDAVMHRYQIN